MKKKILPANHPSRHGFVLLHDTIADGIGPAEWTDSNPFVLYATVAEAEAERLSWVELAADRATADDPEPDDNESVWVEPAVLLANGSLRLTALDLTLSRDEMNARLYGPGSNTSGR